MLVCLNQVYKEIYGDDEEDVLNIPGMPLLTVEGVVAIYERGCISAETMAEFMMNSVNASKNVIDKERVKKLDEHFLKMLEMQEQQTESNIAATNVTAQQKQQKDAQSGQGLSKKMRKCWIRDILFVFTNLLWVLFIHTGIELERTSKVSST